MPLKNGDILTYRLEGCMYKARHIVGAKSSAMDQTDHNSVSKATVFRDLRTLMCCVEHVVGSKAGVDSCGG